MLMIRKAAKTEFVRYVEGFYGVGGVYAGKGEAFGKPATVGEIEAALAIRLRHSVPRFNGDSADRELVRDIMLALRGIPLDQLEWRRYVGCWLGASGKGRPHRCKDGKERSVLVAARLTPADRNRLLEIGNGSVTKGIEQLLARDREGQVPEGASDG